MKDLFFFNSNTSYPSENDYAAVKDLKALNLYEEFAF